MSVEPQIHSFNTDCLTTDHVWWNKTVYCGHCNAMVHAFNNECMSEWVEWGGKALCLPDAITAFADGVDPRLFDLLASKYPCVDPGE